MNFDALISGCVRKARSGAFSVVKGLIPLGAFIVRTNPKLRELILDALASSPINNAGQALISTRAVTDNEGNLLAKTPNISLDSEIVRSKVHDVLLVLIDRTGNQFQTEDLEKIKDSSRKVMTIEPVLSGDSTGLNSLIREALDDRITTIVVIDAGATPSFQEFIQGSIYLNSRSPYAAVATQTSKIQINTNGEKDSQPTSTQHYFELNEKQLPILLGNLLHVRADYFRQYLNQSARDFPNLQLLMTDLANFLNSRNYRYVSRLRNNQNLPEAVKSAMSSISHNQGLVIEDQSKALRSLKILSHNKAFGKHFRSKSGKKRVLFIQPISGGGLKSANELLSEILAGSVETYHLVSSGQTFKIYDGTTGDLIADEKIEIVVSPKSHRSPDYDGALAKWLLDLEIDIVHIEHMAWQSAGLADVCSLTKVPYVVSIHDFYLSCASHTLLDENNRPCFGKCTAGTGPCNVSLWPKSEFQNLKNDSVSTWREHFTPILQNAKTLIAPSQFAANQIKKSYPNLSTNFSIVPHSLRYEQKPAILGHTKYGGPQPIKVVVIGELTVNKGTKEIERIFRADTAGRLELHFFGEAFGSISEVGVHHGAYKPSELSEKLRALQPDVALFAAIGPETFSFTLSEIWSNGIPVVGRDLGAIGERIRESGAGLLVSANAPVDEWLAALMKFGNPNDYEAEQAKESLKLWLEENKFELAKSRMKDRYLEIYSDSSEIKVELI